MRHINKINIKTGFPSCTAMISPISPPKLLMIWEFCFVASILIWNLNAGATRACTGALMDTLVFETFQESWLNIYLFNLPSNALKIIWPYSMASNHWLMWRLLLISGVIIVGFADWCCAVVVGSCVLVFEPVQ